MATLDSDIGGIVLSETEANEESSSIEIEEIDKALEGFLTGEFDAREINQRINETSPQSESTPEPFSPGYTRNRHQTLPPFPVPRITEKHRQPYKTKESFSEIADHVERMTKDQLRHLSNLKEALEREINQSFSVSREIVKALDSYLKVCKEISNVSDERLIPISEKMKEAIARINSGVPDTSDFEAGSEEFYIRTYNKLVYGILNKQPTFNQTGPAFLDRLKRFRENSSSFEAWISRIKKSQNKNVKLAKENKEKLVYMISVLIDLVDVYKRVHNVMLNS